MTQNANDTPLQITVADGQIIITGPEGLSEALTPEAAARSADRLLAAVDEAGGAQVYQKPLG